MINCFANVYQPATFFFSQNLMLHIGYRKPRKQQKCVCRNYFISIKKKKKVILYEIIEKHYYIADGMYGLKKLNLILKL